MTIRLTARVGSSRRLGNVGNAWYATVHVRDDQNRMLAGRMATAASWPDAMRSAREMRAALDAELMSEVHESRASRRTERCGGCRDLGPHRNTRDCEFYTPEAP